MTEGDLLEICDEPILNEGLNNNEGNNQQTYTYLNSTNLIKYYGENYGY